MSQKRMFSKDVVRTDSFLDMSLSAQALYFQLCMDADVKGFVYPRVVMRMLGSTADDLNALVGRGFAIPFESGVIVITHWKINNNLRLDREALSQFVEEEKLLLSTETGVYQLIDNSRSTPGVLPRRIGKDRIGKDRIGEGEEHAPLKENKFSKREDITDSVVEELARKYEVPVDFVVNCWDSAQNWLDCNGKVKKNYKAFLANWVKSDMEKYRKEVRQNAKPRAIDAEAIIRARTMASKDEQRSIHS